MNLNDGLAVLLFCSICVNFYMIFRGEGAVTTRKHSGYRFFGGKIKMRSKDSCKPKERKE